MFLYLQVIESNEEQSKFEAIYKEYYGLMYYVAYEKLNHPQDAEDVVHHVFIKIAENIKSIEPVSPKTKQLVVTMVYNRAIDLYRVRSKHPTTSYDDEFQNHDTWEMDDEDILTKCIMNLSDQQRMVIWLKYIHGYSLREISKLLGISLTGAQKIDQRAKKRLEELYRKERGFFDQR